MKKLFRFFSHPWAIFISNLLLAAGAYAGNEIFQAFCKPVTWASAVLLFFITAFLAWPFVPEEKKQLKNFLAIFHGAGFCVCVYCTWFGKMMLVYSLFALVAGVGIFGFAPVIFLVQIVYRFVKTQDTKRRWFFFAGVLPLIVFQLYFALQYRALENAITKIPPQERTPEKLAGVLPRNYMAERFAGTYFRYHTSYCEYDGWRPPLHDPFLVISRRLFPSVDNSVPGYFAERAALYRLMFPGKNAYAGCNCSDLNGDSKTYPENAP
ncbi:MAG TPA: hypothetical protein VFU15_17330 [Bacteroidia bacterium]|nr:hypothetical protein [Bacteroidia bacterium]